MQHLASAWHAQLYFPLVQIFCGTWLLACCWHIDANTILDLMGGVMNSLNFITDLKASKQSKLLGPTHD